MTCNLSGESSGLIMLSIFNAAASVSQRWLTLRTCSPALSMNGSGPQLSALDFARETKNAVNSPSIKGTACLEVDQPPGLAALRTN